MNLEDFWNQYQRDIFVAVIGSVVTLLLLKWLPWISQNLLLNPFLWVAKRVSKKWEKRNFELEYLNWLIEDNKYLQVRGLRMHTVESPELESIFIPLQVTTSLQANTKSHENKEVDQTIVSASKMIQDNRRVVVLGDPGSGKTTLVRYLVLSYARLLRNNRVQGDRAETIRQRLGMNSTFTSASSNKSSTKAPLPLYLLFRSITSEQLKKKNFRLEDVVFGRFLSPPRGYLSERLEAGNCIVFLDGLDEVPSNERRDVVEWVEDLVSTYPDNKYIVTSRVVGYTDPLTNGFMAHKLEDFTDDDIRSFIRQWYLAVETSAGKLLTDREKILEQANDLIETILDNKQVRLLGVNPLLLSIIALVHRSRVKLPEKRVDLYDECTLVLLGYWDQAKGLFGKLQPSQKRTLLEVVAYEMQIRGIKEVTGEDLTAILDMELPKYGGGYGDTLHFLNEVKERSGLLIERGTNIFSFSHATFQEYMVARFLIRVDNKLEVMLKNVQDDQWQEVLLLFCGMQDPSPLIEKLLALQDDLFCTWSSLAGQCVSEALYVNHALRKDIIAKLLQLALHTEFASLRKSLMRICHKIDPLVLLAAIENECHLFPQCNTSAISDSFPLLINDFSDTLCLDLLSNDELRLPFLRILPKKRELPHRCLEFLAQRVTEINESEKLAAIRILALRPEPGGLELLNQWIQDESEDVRGRAASAIGKYQDPKVLSMLGIILFDKSGYVLHMAMNSIIDVFNVKTDVNLFQYGLISLVELLKHLGNKKSHASALFAIVGGIALWLGKYILRSSGYLDLGLDLDKKDQNDPFARFFWSTYRGSFWVLAMISKAFLFRVIPREDLNFWIAFYLGLTANALDDPHCAKAFSSIMPSISRRHLDFLAPRSKILTGDIHVLEQFIEALSSHIETIDESWSLGQMMESLLRDEPDLALSLAEKMLESPKAPVRAVGVFSMLNLPKRVSQKHIEQLESAGKDESETVRKWVAWAIFEIEELRKKELISSLLKDQSEDVLVEMIDTIDQLADINYINEMQSLLSNEKERVKNAAYDALHSISKKHRVSPQ